MRLLAEGTEIWGPLFGACVPSGPLSTSAWSHYQAPTRTHEQLRTSEKPNMRTSEEPNKAKFPLIGLLRSSSNLHLRTSPVGCFLRSSLVDKDSHPLLTAYLVRDAVPCREERCSKNRVHLEVHSEDKAPPNWMRLLRNSLNLLKIARGFILDSLLCVVFVR